MLILLKTYKAVTFDELFDGVSAIPWEELLPADVYKRQCAYGAQRRPCEKKPGGQKEKVAKQRPRVL